MSSKAGLWIDHRRAILVRLEGEELHAETIESSLEKRVRMTGGRAPYGVHVSTPEATRDNRYAQHLDDYFDQVMDRLGDASCLYVFGPGQAKQEFITAVESSGRFRDVTTEMETTDKLTEKQVIAQVKEHFRA